MGCLHFFHAVQHSTLLNHVISFKIYQAFNHNPSFCVQSEITIVINIYVHEIEGAISGNISQNTEAYKKGQLQFPFLCTKSTTLASM